MCKVLEDEPQRLAATTTTTTTPKKRVRFCAFDVYEFPRIDDTSDHTVWYTRQDYQTIRAEVAEMVQAKTEHSPRMYDPNWFCWRGLEFLKLDADIPSRKERRQRFVQHAMIFQSTCHNRCRRRSSCSAKKHQQQQQLKEEEEEAELMRAFCTKLSQTANQKALALAFQDEAEARLVYQECHLIYQGSDGKQRSMFGTHRPTLCRTQTNASSWEEQEETTGYFFDDVLSYPTVLFRAIQSVGSAAFLATRVN